MAKSETAAQDTRQEVIESLRQVLADIEAGKLRGGGWREQYIAQRSASSRQAALPKPPPTRPRLGQWQAFKRVRRTLRTSCMASTSLPGTSRWIAGATTPGGLTRSAVEPALCLPGSMPASLPRSWRLRRWTTDSRCHRARTARKLRSDGHARGTRDLTA